MAERLADYLLSAVAPSREHVAIVVRATYRPVGGDGRAVMPPTYPVDNGDRDPNGAYLMAPRLVDGVQRATVVIDQEPSQANRVEEALRDAVDAGVLGLPMLELRAGAVRLTSLDFPHRYADAYVRDSMIGGVRFDQTPVGKRLREVSAADVRPLYEREPCSLLLGAWDSHRKGRWPRFPRLYAAVMFGLDPVTGRRMGGRMDPVNLTGSVADSSSAEAGWQFVPDGAKAKGKKLSEIGHGNIAPQPVHGGVTVSQVRRIASISLAGLERLRFGGAPAPAASAARAALVALALAGDRLAFGRPSVWLRSGCDLAKVLETVGLERPGDGTVDEIPVTAEAALEAFCELRDRAAESGISMHRDTIAIEPVPELAAAIKFAVTSGARESED
jgi:CRISPR-associated protein Csb1